jgi:hypothetical protein
MCADEDNKDVEAERYEKGDNPAPLLPLPDTPAKQWRYGKRSINGIVTPKTERSCQ